MLSEARDRRWVKSAKVSGGSDVQDLIGHTIDHLAIPKLDRRAEFIAGELKTSYQPDWFYDGRVEGICNHSTREHMPRDLHRYLYAACFARCRGYSPKLKEFPADLLPEHSDVHMALNGHVKEVVRTSAVRIDEAAWRQDLPFITAMIRKEIDTDLFSRPVVYRHLSAEDPQLQFALTLFPEAISLREAGDVGQRIPPA